MWFGKLGGTAEPDVNKPDSSQQELLRTDRQHELGREGKKNKKRIAVRMAEPRYINMYSF